MCCVISSNTYAAQSFSRGWAPDQYEPIGQEPRPGISLLAPMLGPRWVPEQPRSASILIAFAARCGRSALMSPSPPLLVHHRAALLASPLNAAFSFNIVGARGPARRRAHRRLFTSISAVGGEETRFEVDRSKAREALQRLDQQLESLAQQETLPKRKRPSPPPLGTPPNFFRSYLYFPFAVSLL
ncbi:hypothetical protein BHM03_00019610 [Ensete ventricosum]|nr:hypothetical protein BHM03_00019610 [Ensete ventricosum]